MLDTTLSAQKKSVNGLGIRSRLGVSADYLNWMPQDTDDQGSGVRDAEVLYSPVVAASRDNEIETTSPRQSLEQLVQNHLAARRGSYMERGWTALSKGEYLNALRAFSMAENASADVPDERAYIRLVMVYTSIAAGQYSAAGNSLAWLLTPDPKTGRAVHSNVLNRIFDENRIGTIGELYAARDEAESRAPGWVDPDYLRQNQEIENMVIQAPDAALPRALAAIVEWGRGRRTNAIFEARKIAETGGRLGGLAQFLEEANVMRQSGLTTYRQTASAVPGLPDLGPVATRPSP